MSQFPTTLENPGGPARAAANRAVAIPQTGIIAGGNVVPQQVLPPVSEGAQLAAQLGQDLGLIGSAADEIRQYQDRQLALSEHAKHEAERQAAHDRANAEAIDTHERGQGALDAATRLPEIVQQISEGKITRQPTSASEQAKAIIDGLVKGQPDAYSEGFRRTAQDNVARALTGVDQRLIDDNKKALAQSAMSAAVLADTPERLAQSFAAAKVVSPNISDTEAMAMTYLPAMEDAASRGDRAKFAIATEALGTNFAEEQNAAKIKLQSAIDAGQRQQVEAFHNGIANLYNNSAPLDMVEKEIRAARGQVPENAIQGELDQLAARRHQIATQNAALEAKMLKDQQQFAYTSTAQVLAGSGQLWALPEAPEGSGLSREKTVDAAMQAEMTRIANQYAGDQNAALANQLGLAAVNDYMVPAWKRLLGAGTSAAIDSNISGEDLSKQPLPQATVAGYDLYRRMRVQAPTLLSKLEDQDRRFYETVEALQEFSGNTSPNSLQQSLIGARRVLTSKDPTGLSASALGRLDTEVSKAANGGFWNFTTGDNAENVGDIEGAIRRKAELFIKAGIGDKDAVKRAAEIVRGDRVTIRHWSVDLSTSNLPLQMRSDKVMTGIADYAVGQWQKAEEARKPQDRTGIDAANLTLMPIGGFWYLVDRNNPFYPVSGGPGISSFTTRDLHAFYIAGTSLPRIEKEAQIKADTLKTNAVRNVPPPTTSNSVMDGLGQP